MRARILIPAVGLALLAGLVPVPTSAQAPQSQPPKTQAPKAKAPVTQKTPKTPAPKTEAPKAQAPAVQAATAQTPKAPAPALITSCGQSPGANSMNVLARRAGVQYTLKEDATAQDVAGKKYGTLIVVTGASLKGMGAAGVSIDDEIKRTAALIAEARKQGMTVIGAHIEGMSRRAQGASPGDNSDEMSIDAVCPNANFMIVRKDGNEDGRFSTIAKTKNIPLVLFEKNLELVDVLKGVFAK